jgi:hypothetical protein
VRVDRRDDHVVATLHDQRRMADVLQVILNALAAGKSRSVRRSLRSCNRTKPSPDAWTRRALHKGEVIRFIPKSELERAHLVREARAIYDGIFPPADAISETTRRRSIRVDFAPPPVAGRTQLCVSPRYPPFAGPATTQFLACDAGV